MYVVIRNETIEVKSLMQAQEVWIAARNKNKWLASEVPGVYIYVQGKKIARISYNGRIWSPERWTASSKLILEAPY